MNLYKDYEAKVAKIAKKFAFVKRHKFPIIGIVVTLFTFLFTMLGVSGIIQKDLSLNKQEFVYGEPISFEKSTAFISSTHYEYALDETNPTWTDVVPTTVGDYLMRTYTYNGYKVKRYGATSKFRITPKEIDLKITSQYVVYGEKPFTNADSVLNKGDSIEYIGVNYENLSSIQPGDSTNVEIDTNSIQILNAKGDDVTSSYSIKTEKQYLRINRRELTLTSNSLSKDYDGIELKDSNVVISDGSLAKNDYFETTPTAIGSATSVLFTRNTITPTINNLHIHNPSLGEVTHLYNISYNEGYLSVNRKELIVEGPTYETTYNGEYQNPPLNSYNASSLKVTGLASTDRITNVTFSMDGNSLLTGERIIKFTYEIRNSSNENVSSNYNNTDNYGRFIIKKKDLIVTPSPKNSTQSNSPIIYDHANKKYTKEYDGSAVQTEIETSSIQGLCQNDEYRIISSPNHSTPGTYYLNNGLSIRVRNGTYSINVTTTGYNIIYENRILEITKKPITISVPNINLFECNNVIDDNLVSYSITNGGLINGHRINFTPKRQTKISEGSFNLFDLYTLNIYNSLNIVQNSYYDINVNSPMIYVQKAKFALNLPSNSLEYNASSRSYEASLSDNTITLDENKSNLPSNITINVIEVSTSLTNVEKHVFTSNDITSFSASYSLSVNKNNSQTNPPLQMNSSDVTFEFVDTPYFEIYKRDINVTFNPPVKYFDNRPFDPNLLIDNNLYTTIPDDSLCNNHHFAFITNRNITGVGTYTDSDLKQAYTLKIYDNYNNDKTSNYNLTYSFENPLVIKRATIDITIKDRDTKIFSNVFSINDLLYRTYNGEETSTFDGSSNDNLLLTSSYYDSERITDYRSNISSDYGGNFDFSCKLGIDPQKDAGTYDIKVKSFTLSINDIYSTNITSKDYVDINVTNGNNGYEIRKRNISFSIPNLTYIYDGNNIDYNYELDTSNLANSLISGHKINITGNSISQVGTYDANSLGLVFKILDSNNNDVTNNYQLNWNNRNSFSITVERVSVICERSNSFTNPTRIYDGTYIEEESFYERVYSPNAIDDNKHSYSLAFEFKDGQIPDSYYDAGTILLSATNPSSTYTDIYCYKEYNGQTIKILVQDIQYNIASNKNYITEQRQLNIILSDTVYYVGSEEEYVFDYAINPQVVQITGEGLASGDTIRTLKLREGNGINGSNLDLPGVTSVDYDVSNYTSYFEIEIFNTNRNKVVTNNYNINYSGTIQYKKASLSIQVTNQPSLLYSGEEYEITSSVITKRDLPSQATLDIQYKIITDEDVLYASSYKTDKIGSYYYAIEDVKVYYKGRDISSSVDITYYKYHVASANIVKSDLSISTDSYELGLFDNYEYQLPDPRITYVAFGSVSAFKSTFTITFEMMVDDPNGIFIVTENGNIKIINYGTTSNQIRGVKIIHNATQEDVTDNFNITWIVGTITGVDIGIT